MASISDVVEVDTRETLVLVYWYSTFLRIISEYANTAKFIMILVSIVFLVLCYFVLSFWYLVLCVFVYLCFV